MILINSIIAILADLGVKICIFMGLWMINGKLGATALGLQAIMLVADYLIARENQKNLQKLIEQSQKL